MKSLFCKRGSTLIKKFAALAVFVALVGLTSGCATRPNSSLLTVDVSKLENGNVLTAAEIDSAVRGKQMVGRIIRASGTQIQGFLNVFESDGMLKGSLYNETDHGRWQIDNSTDRLCSTWTRWMNSCGVATVRDGELHLLNPVTRGQIRAALNTC